MIDDLLNQAKALHEEAESVLEELDLLNVLSKHGTVEIVGSFTLDLMTWRDIDIEVIVPKLERSMVQEICSYLAGLERPRIDFTIMDNLLDKNPNLPNSLYVGVKYFKKDLPHEQRSSGSPFIWKLDIHFVTNEDSRGVAVTKDLKEKITEENKKIILELKHELASHPRYRKEIFSMDIYKSVFDHNVKNIDEFKEYLNQTGRDL